VKRILFGVLILVLILSLSLPTVVMAVDPVISNISIVSDTDVKVVRVYNKYGGATNYVDTDFNAVRSAEPNLYPDTYPIEGAENFNSTWDTGTGKYFQDVNPGADWIWDTPRAEDPATLYSPGDDLYDDDASHHGRVVVFEKTFEIEGSPQYATLHIAADNCYEVWINNWHFRSSTAQVDGWEATELYQASVDSENWQNVDHHTGLGSYLVEGMNTIRIMAGNEYYPLVYDVTETNNDVVPPWVADPNYIQRNPGALIFKLDINYVSNPVPEVPSGILLGVGLAAIGIAVIMKKRRDITAAE
jgi:hypothetical protein